MVDQHSLWLIPSGETYDKLDEIIRGLSKKFNSHYFPPHVTLLGKITLPEERLISRTQALSYLLSPFQISLENIDYSEDYFRSIYIKAKKDAPILDANYKARTIFESSRFVSMQSNVKNPQILERARDIKSRHLDGVQKPEHADFRVFDIYESYMPHLSVLYSNITQKSKKSALKSIPDNLDLSFNVDQIHIYSTTGPVNEWFKLRSFDLT